MIPSEWSGTAWEGTDVAARSDVEDGSLLDFVQRINYPNRLQPYRMPTIRTALGVPAFQRAVTLIANTTGSLTIQAFRNTILLDETPRLIARPDPYRTPRDFYRDAAYCLATRGEAILCVMSREAGADSTPNALVVVPPRELKIEENTRDRLRPTYSWGGIVSTRWTPVTPEGRFVHITYLQEPGELRGMGPLQMGQAAASVAVEAQEWAANFYSEGGIPSVVIKHAGELSPEEDDDGFNEAERLRNQFMEKAHNVPRVIDQNIEKVESLPIDMASAQALGSRDYSNGDGARLFGIPGALLEYGVSGVSLTYQNLADVWTNFVRGCLAPNYLEPIEQAVSDLLSRSTVARFLTSGLDRADPQSRWNIYSLAVAVLGQDAAAELARQGEGIGPGNPEVQPVPYAPPAAIPVSMPEVRVLPAETAHRCDGMRVRRRNGIGNLEPCGALLAESGRFVGTCRRCRKVYASAA